MKSISPAREIGAFNVVQDFEAALCEYTGAPYAVTTTSCTMAILLALANHLQPRGYADLLSDRAPEVNIPKHTYVGVPYAIREAGGRPTFRDEAWLGAYQLKPYPVWDSARWFTSGMWERGRGGVMVCVSFHWAKTLGIQQGGAILHDDPAADAWLRRARFDGRAEGVPPAQDDFPLHRAWHAYMAPATAAEGLTRLAHLPRHNEPLPNDDYPDLSTLKAFQ
jgi:dTDP-4-amino-4,6-dideoxygalactose transaminase